MRASYREHFASVDFLEGLKDAMPISLAFFFLFFSVGALANQSGLGLLQSILMTSFVFAAPLQIPLLHLANHQNLYFIMTSTLFLTVILNFRFVFMSASLAPYLKKHPLAEVLCILPMLSASTYVVTHTKFTSNDNLDHFPYFIGVCLASASTAIISTGLGYELIQFFHSSFIDSILLMILPIHFTILSTSYMNKAEYFISFLLGFILMPFSLTLTSSFAFLLTPVLAATFILLRGYK